MSDKYSGQERRESPRKDAELEVKYQDIMHADLRETGKTKLDRTMSTNISAGGLCIYTDSPNPVGSGLALVVSLPGYREPIITGAKVVYINLINQGESKKYTMGLQFVNIGKENLKLINDFIGK